MNLSTTLVAFALSCLGFVAATWQARRERPPGRPNLMPWIGLQFVAVVAAIVFAAHLLTLLTGVELRGQAP